MRFARFWWEFVVGDDWMAALGVVVAIGATALLAAAGVAAWWLLPVAVACVLYASLRRSGAERGGTTLRTSGVEPKKGRT